MRIASSDQFYDKDLFFERNKGGGKIYFFKPLQKGSSNAHIATEFLVGVWEYLKFQSIFLVLNRYLAIDNEINY